MTGPMTLPYVPPKGTPGRAAIACVVHGILMTCPRAEWPEARVALTEQMDEWRYLDTKTTRWLVRLAASEIARLDAHYADPDAPDVTAQGVIVPLSETA
jgi:hypothetical protein